MYNQCPNAKDRIGRTIGWCEKEFRLYYSHMSSLLIRLCSYMYFRLVDFGLARFKAEAMTSAIGYLPFTAPEAFRGDSYTEKADVSSLFIGIIILQTGRWTKVSYMHFPNRCILLQCSSSRSGQVESLMDRWVFWRYWLAKSKNHSIQLEITAKQTMPDSIAFLFELCTIFFLLCLLSHVCPRSLCCSSFLSCFTSLTLYACQCSMVSPFQFANKAANEGLRPTFKDSDVIPTPWKDLITRCWHAGENFSLCILYFEWEKNRMIRDPWWG